MRGETMLSRAAVIAADIDVVRAYLPANYRAVRVAGAPGQVLIIGQDHAGWTLDGYVIPRLASGLHFAREEHADVYIGTSPEPDVEGLREVAYLVRPGLSHSTAWHLALGRTPSITTQD